MNREEIKARIAVGINDDPDDPVFFDEAQFNALVDDAVEFIVAETRSVRRTCFVPLRAGSMIYSTRSLADDMMFPLRIWNNQNDHRLTATDFQTLDKTYERWQRTNQDPQCWFPVSWDLIGIWPWPAAPGGVLRIDYLAWPRSLQDDEDEPELLEITHEAVILYGRYMGMLKQWDADRAKDVFKDLAKEEIMGKAKSGILRIKHRSFSRNPSLSFPSMPREASDL
jgi:hypothetical protein